MRDITEAALEVYLKERGYMRTPDDVGTDKAHLL